MIEGTRIIRTSEASIRTAKAIPMASIFTVGSVDKTKGQRGQHRDGHHDRGGQADANGLTALITSGSLATLLMAWFRDRARRARRSLGAEIPAIRGVF
jgi:hypothetical protein